MALAGTRNWAMVEGSLPLLWWLVLGLDLSWRKGYFGAGVHDWIGVRYDLPEQGPTMELPRKYLEETIIVLEPLTKPTGTLPLKQVQKALGKAARVGFVVPAASPFIASLWAGFRQGRLQALEGKPGTVVDRMPVRRFATAAKWFVTMLQEAIARKGSGSHILTRRMGSGRREPLDAGVPVISFDASPWGEVPSFGFVMSRNCTPTFSGHPVR